MPKVSKIRSPASKIIQDVDPVGHFVCTRCGREFRQQRRNFLTSQSPLYARNNGFLPVCVTCVDSLFMRYKEDLGTDEAAVKRMCMKFDIYWSDSLFSAARKTLDATAYVNAGAVVFFKTYVSKCNLLAFCGKTYDDTIREEAEQAVAQQKESLAQQEQEMQEVIDRRVAEEVEQRLLSLGVGAADVAAKDAALARDIDFWGDGFSEAEYVVLNRKYKQWEEQATDMDEDGNLPIGTSTLFRQICVLELQINRNMNAGKSTESAVKQLNDLIGSVNARPSQAKDDGAGGSFDSLPFGVGIRIFENSKPIPKPLPQLEDVDGIVRYISIWFLGHLCKMLRIKNTYCRMYEDEIERLRVDRPDLEGEDDETVFNTIFGDEPS